jgi:hypothetical protein
VTSDQTHAFLWTKAGGMRDLNDLIPGDSNVLLVSAVGINSRGQIIAFGGDASTYHHDSPIKIYLLTPVS